MSKMLILHETLTNIAQAIRDKMYNNANNNMFYPNEMADLINNLYDWNTEFAYGIEPDNAAEKEFWCGEYVTSMKQAFMRQSYRDCPIVCGNNVEDMSYAYYKCTNLTNSFYIGPKVENMAHTFEWCPNIWNVPVCHGLVKDMSYAYANCFGFKYANNDNRSWYYLYEPNHGKVIADPVCGENVNRFDYAYANAWLLYGTPACGDNVKNMDYAYYHCFSLIGPPACGDNVENMTSAYEYCNNMGGTPVVGPNVVYMDNAYCECHNITGDVVLAENVCNMKYSYFNCYRLGGHVTIGNNVKHMDYAFYRCHHLANTNCGPNVKSMNYAYYACIEAEGMASIGPNVDYSAVTSAYGFCTCLTGAKIESNVNKGASGTAMPAFSDCWRIRDVIIDDNAGPEFNEKTQKFKYPSARFENAISIKKAIPYKYGYYSGGMYTGSFFIEGNLFEGLIDSNDSIIPTRFMSRINLLSEPNTNDNNRTEYDVISDDWMNLQNSYKNLLKGIYGNPATAEEMYERTKIEFPPMSAVNHLNYYTNKYGLFKECWEWKPYIFEDIENGTWMLKENLPNFMVPGVIPYMGAGGNIVDNHARLIKASGPDIGNIHNYEWNDWNNAEDGVIDYPSYDITYYFSKTYRYEQFY